MWKHQRTCVRHATPLNMVGLMHCNYVRHAHTFFCLHFLLQLIFFISSSSCVCLSDLETSRGEPGSRVLVQADNSFSARRRPVLWADIQDVVHCLLWGTTFTDRGVLEAPLQHGRAEPAYTRAKAVEGCPLLSRQVEARDAVWIADEVVQSRRRSCQPIVFPAGPEPGLLRHACGRQIAEMMGLLGEGVTSL